MESTEQLILKQVPASVYFITLRTCIDNTIASFRWRKSLFLNYVNLCPSFTGNIYSIVKIIWTDLFVFIISVVYSGNLFLWVESLPTKSSQKKYSTAFSLPLYMDLPLLIDISEALWRLFFSSFDKFAKISIRKVDF